MYRRPIFFCITCIISISTTMNGQHASLPYHEIPEPVETYTSGALVSRLLDGLGYRYYWATEGLTTENLAYRASADSRTMKETLDHIHGLSLTIVNAPQARPNMRPLDLSEISW